MVLKKHLIIVLPSLKAGGSERVGSTLANFASNKGYKVDIVLMTDHLPFYELNREVNVHQPFFPKKHKLVYYFKIIKYLRKKILQIGANNVFVLGYLDLVTWALFNTNVKLTGSYRSSPDRKWTPLNKNFISKLFFKPLFNLFSFIGRRRLNKVIVQSKYAKKVFAPQFSSDTEFKVIPNFLPPLKQYHVEKNKQVVCIGRLSEEKGQNLLINAWEKVKSDDWELVLVGDGPKRYELELKVNNLKLNNVRFEGFQNQVHYYLQESKIFVLPSLVEGFPNALLEAMANGLACVSFDCVTGPSELIHHGENGLLVEVHDVNSLASSIQNLIDDEGYRKKLGENAQAVRSQYDIEKIGMEYLSFILKE